MSELYFEQLCNAANLDITFIDGVIDYYVEGHKVEIKSAKISTRNGLRYTIGHFWFSDEEKKFLRRNDVWLMFIVASPITNDFMMLGATKSSDARFLYELPSKISIHKILELCNLITFDDFKKQLQAAKEIQEEEKCRTRTEKEIAQQ